MYFNIQPLYIDKYVLDTDHKLQKLQQQKFLGKILKSRILFNVNFQSNDSNAVTKTGVCIRIKFINF